MSARHGHVHLYCSMHGSICFANGRARVMRVYTGSGGVHSCTGSLFTAVYTGSSGDRGLAASHTHWDWRHWPSRPRSGRVPWLVMVYDTYFTLDFVYRQPGCGTVHTVDCWPRRPRTKEPKAPPYYVAIRLLPSTVTVSDSFIHRTYSRLDMRDSITREASVPGFSRV